MGLRDADDLLAPAVEEAIAGLELRDADAAIVKLARRYASVIDTHRDAAWAMRWLGPLLHDCLESLGATPAARAKVKEGRPAGGQNQLDRLRAARRA